MPLKRCGGNGYKWGDNGKCYTGPSGKKKAIKQGIAIEGPDNFKKIMSNMSGEDAALAAEAMIESARPYPTLPTSANPDDPPQKAQERVNLDSTRTVVQAYIFPKGQWKTKYEVERWLKVNGKLTTLQESKIFWRADQIHQSRFDVESFSSEIISGVKGNDEKGKIEVVKGHLLNDRAAALLKDYLHGKRT